jgi:HlyD family secretion protein/epimerase transport system membrane fusion protein
MDEREHAKLIRDLKSDLRKAYSKPVSLGMVIFIVLFGGIGYWVTTARIDKAALAFGQIVSDSNNKVVQHLEGGIIKEINVKEGDSVKEGEVLVKLSQTSASANREIVSGALNTAKAEYYRLISERDGREKIAFPQNWLNNQDEYGKFMESQRQIFSERQKSYLGRVSILEERNKQLQSQINGVRSQIKSALSQLEYTEREIAVVERLLRSGNTTMARMLSLKSRKAEIEGRVGELRSNVAKTEQAISENKLNIINLKNERLNEVVQKIKEVQAQMNEYQERSFSAEDTLTRTEILAPISGVVKDLQFDTISGVIPPGAEIMTIVPQDDDLIAEVKIQPIDRDIVKPGLKSRVRLSAYSARHVPMLTGSLEYISPDSFQDQSTQETYYKGRVKIDISEMDKYLNEKKEQILYPGMPVEVYITTGARSPLEYMADPITNTFRRSFREE